MKRSVCFFALVVSSSIAIAQSPRTTQNYELTVDAEAKGYAAQDVSNPYCRIFHKKVGRRSKWFAYGVDFFLGEDKPINNFSTFGEDVAPALENEDMGNYGNSYDGIIYRRYSKTDSANSSVTQIYEMGITREGVLTGAARFQVIEESKSGTKTSREIICHWLSS